MKIRFEKITQCGGGYILRIDEHFIGCFYPMEQSEIEKSYDGYHATGNLVIPAEKFSGNGLEVE